MNIERINHTAKRKDSRQVKCSFSSSMFEDGIHVTASDAILNKFLDGVP